MQFISEEQMKKFNELGYTFSSQYTPNKIGSTYHVIVTDKDGKEVVHTSSSYGNGSGHGYAMSFAQENAVAQLEEYIENPNPTTEQVIDEDFLLKLTDWGYIHDYGYDKDGTMTIIFDSWQQLEGREDRQTGEMRPSIYAKFVKLAEEGKLKPSINYTLTHVDTAFSDEYCRCDHCGKVYSREWDGLNYIETTSELLCNECTNESKSAIDFLIEEAKEDFSKAVPVMVEENKLKELGYSPIDTSKDFSTRYEWGEEDWSCYNIHADKCEEWCNRFNGFAKLTWVGQFDANFQLYFPNSKIEEARQFTGIGAKV